MKNKEKIKINITIKIGIKRGRGHNQYKEELGITFKFEKNFEKKARHKTKKFHHITFYHQIEEIYKKRFPPS